MKLSALLVKNENERSYDLMLKVPVNSSEDSSYQVIGEKARVR